MEITSLDEGRTLRIIFICFRIFLNLRKVCLYNRLEDEEQSLVKDHEGLSEKWHQGVQEARNWCEETRAKLENMNKDGDASDYDELSERKQQLQVLNQECNDSTTYCTNCILLLPWSLMLIILNLSSRL